MYGKYQRIASVGPSTTANLVSWLPNLQDKIIDCPNGINVEVFASASTPGKQALFSVAENTPVILCVGSLGPAKGHDTLLRAISLVPDVVLVVAGVGQLSEQLQVFAESLGIASRVQFLGRRGDVPQLLKAADLYVQPSRWEGCSLAMLEAMAAGKPIIASNIPGLAQVVGEAGLLHPVGDADMLAQHITTLLNDSDLRQRLGAAARQRARMFDIDRTLDCHEKLYKDVVATVSQ
jgi:glycosyltransferase involved in cell wall biosynthesis